MILLKQNTLLNDPFGNQITRHKQASGIISYAWEVSQDRVKIGISTYEGSIKRRKQ